MESLFLKNFKSLVRRDRYNVDVHCRDSKRFTLLHYVIANQRNINEHFKTVCVDSLYLIASLVALGADVNAKDREQMTPLHIAVGNNDTESIECLLKLGADINAQCQVGVTSLSEAVRLKNVQAVRVLAQLGLAQSVGGVQYQTVFTPQMVAGNIGMLKYLVKKGANINATSNMVPILHAAIQSGNIEIVQILLDHGAAVNSKSISNLTIVMESLGYDITSPAWFTELKNSGADFNIPSTESYPVYEAVTSGRLDIIEFLIKYKAGMGSMETMTPIDKGCMVTFTPIDKGSMVTIIPIAYPLEREQFGLLEHLIKCGADINARYEPWCMPIVAACRNGNIDIVKALWKKPEAGRNSISFKGFTMLFFKLLHVVKTIETSSVLKHVTAMKKLISLGANVNDRFDVCYALLEAVVRGDFNMVEELVKLGEVIDLHTMCNQTLLTHWLESYNVISSSSDSQIYKDVLISLVEAGVDVNVQCDHTTLLLLAVERSDTEMVETLARLGANMDQSMRAHLTPFHLTLSYLDAAVVVDTLDILIENGADPYAEYLRGVSPLLAALECKNTKMVQSLLQCGAIPILGYEYSKCSAFTLALQASNYDAIRYLVEKRCANASANVLTGVIQPFDNEVADIVAHFGLKTAKVTSDTILSWYIRTGGNREGVEILLSLKVNKTSGRNVFQTDHIIGSLNTPLIQTDLHIACSKGDLDIVRLMIINKSDVNELDSDGLPPLAYLPLAHFINYQALEETKTKTVIEEVEFKDFLSLGMTLTTIDTLISQPGIGDVQNIAPFSVNEIYKDVEKLILSLVKKCHIFPVTSPWIKRCGSAAEGTKVGIPDEMDFLAVIGSIDQHDIQNSKNDYVHCTNFLNKMNDQFHILFSRKILRSLNRIKFPEHISSACLHVESLIIDKYRQTAITALRLLWKKEPSVEEVSQAPLSSKMELMPCHVSVWVDVVTSVHVKNWPEGALEKTWLLNLDELKSHGYYIVPKPPHVKSALAGEFTDKELQDLWKISFPHLETYHMQRLDKRVKDVYLLAKCVRNSDVCRVMVTDNGSYPMSTEKYVTSYMLKMIFFKNVEYFLSSNLSLGKMVCQVYDELVESLTQGFIPLYFMPHVSAVAGTDVELAKSARAAKILKTFVHACYSSDCQGARGDSAESRVHNQSKSVYQSIEIGQTMAEFPCSSCPMSVPWLDITAIWLNLHGLHRY